MLSTHFAQNVGEALELDWQSRARMIMMNGTCTTFKIDLQKANFLTHLFDFVFHWLREYMFQILSNPLCRNLLVWLKNCKDNNAQRKLSAPEKIFPSWMICFRALGCHCPDYSGLQQDNKASSVEWKIDPVGPNQADLLWWESKKQINSLKDSKDFPFSNQAGSLFGSVNPAGVEIPIRVEMRFCLIRDEGRSNLYAYNVKQVGVCFVQRGRECSKDLQRNIARNVKQCVCTQCWLAQTLWDNTGNENRLLSFVNILKSQKTEIYSWSQM